MSNAVSDPTEYVTEYLLSNIQGGIIICQYNPQSGSSKTLFISDGWTELTGYTLDELNETKGGNPQALLLEEDRAQCDRSYASQMQRGKVYCLEYRLCRKDGSVIWVTDRGVVTETKDGLNHNQSIITDITPMKLNEKKLRMSEERYRIAIKASHAAVMEYDILENRYLHIENAEELFGTDGQSLIAAATNAKLNSEHFSIEDAMRLWYHPDDVPHLIHAKDNMLKQGFSECEARLRQPDGSFLWCKIHQTLLHDEEGKALRSIGYIVNVDEQHKQTERLLMEAQSDALTGLLNKNAMRRITEQTLRSTPHLPHALLMLDVDNFKGVNDQLGHLFGDAVLIEVSAKLRRLFHLDSMVGRMGGDEFAVLIQGGLSESLVAQRAEEICQAFRYTYTGDKADYKISCSVGVALAEPGDSFDSLFRKADQALYQAKANGKDQYVVYSAHQSGQAQQLSCPIRLAQDADSDSGNLQIKERIFELLYDSVDFTGSVNMILSLLGQLLEVSRVYIFENSADACISTNIFEWCAEGICSNMPNMHQLPVAELNYFAQFDSRGICRYTDTSTLPDPLYSLYEAIGVRSTFQVTIMDEGVIRGFMGFDRVDQTLSQSSEQIDIMTFAAKLIGTFIIKKRTDESVKLYNENKMSALDNLPSAIYVIDEDYRLLYMNNFVFSVFPNVLPNQKCYEVFMQNNTPCSDCPALDCHNGPRSTEIFNPYSNLWLLANASTITWSGKDNMRMINCQIINRYKKPPAST